VKIKASIGVWPGLGGKIKAKWVTNRVNRENQANFANVKIKAKYGSYLFKLSIKTSKEHIKFPKFFENNYKNT